jgi:hypothetical protein
MSSDGMKPPDIDQLAQEIRWLYRSGPLKAEETIEGYLQQRLSSYSPGEKRQVLAKLIGAFSRAQKNDAIIGHDPDDVLDHVCALLLGEKAAERIQSSSDLLPRLAESLNLIFDELNQLMAVMHMTLTGEPLEEQTIRQVIASNMVSRDQSQSLRQYLGRIKQVFLTVQQAFKKAAETQIGQVLDELNPAAIESHLGSGFRIGPLKKAEAYGVYSQKYADIRQWFDSGRFMQDFLRAFEAQCRSLSDP